MVSVKLESVSKSFAGKKAVDNLSLEIRDQSFTSILGPVGSGKTTLLRIIAGVESVDRGKVYFDDRDISELPTRDRRVAMVYQNFALYPHMKVHDNIASPLKAARLPAQEIDIRVKSTAEFLGIEPLLGRYPRELSGGEQQRVAIARALVKEADVYLFDEPLTNVDYKIRESMRGELRRIFKEREGTVVYATPDPLDALAMARYVAIVRTGKVEQYGPVEEVYDKPNSTFAGSYFGFPPMNLINSEVVEQDGALRFQAPHIDLEATHLKELVVPGPYVLGLRPNRIHLAGESPAGISMALKVSITEVIGSETIVHLRYSGRELTMHEPRIARYEPGDEIRISFDPNDLYIFDKKTGVLIGRYRS